CELETVERPIERWRRGHPEGWRRDGRWRVDLEQWRERRLGSAGAAQHLRRRRVGLDRPFGASPASAEPMPLDALLRLDLDEFAARPDRSDDSVSVMRLENGHESAVATFRADD